MDGYPTPQGFSDRRGSAIQQLSLTESSTIPACNPLSRVDKHRIPPIGPPTPSVSTPAVEYQQSLDAQQMTGSPPPPPTPAASPRPSQRQAAWNDPNASLDIVMATLQHRFHNCSSRQRTKILASLFDLCTAQELSFAHQFVTPLLKRDPFTSLPDELCLRILHFIDDPKSLARASQVSRRWRDLLSDEMTWKNLCARHDYNYKDVDDHRMFTMQTAQPQRLSLAGNNESGSLSFPETSSGAHHRPGLQPRSPLAAQQPRSYSYKSRFKQRYLVEAAWRSGGTNVSKAITHDSGVVTSLHLTSKYIIVALDNARILVFDTQGTPLRVLQGHLMGVWAMVIWDDILVSGGCDRDVRVWDLRTGMGNFVLRGHTSTVRCLKMSDANTAISGSRDTTLRIWDITTGVCKHVLVGHQSSVRCLEIKGDIVVSGSYDTTAKIWSISEGRCLRTLTGHFSQIYAIAFDGKRIATGSLDTSVRIWDAETGQARAILQGHTSLVGQLQMRGDTLVTGGSDGSVRVWSLQNYTPIHRLAAHDNSVTSLQFDDTRIVSAGSDGRVKVWDVKTGLLVRELIQPAEAVWRVAFEDEKCVAMALRDGRTYMEVWSFSPPPEVLYERPLSLQQRMLGSTDRSGNALDFGFGRSESGQTSSGAAASYLDDVHMTDAGPSTALFQGLFFNE